MENPASASQPPADQLPPVASGPNPGSAPSIQSGTTVDPSPSKNLEQSESLTDGRQGSTPRVPASPSLAPPPSPLSSALPVPAATVPADARSSDDELMDAPPDAPASPLDVPTASTAAAVAAADDEPMESPPADAAPPARADTRPTMADLLHEQETIRRDNAVIEAVRSRIQTPKPLASDIEWIERQYAAGGDWSFIASRMDQARLYALPRAKYDMVIDTGRTLAKTPLQKIMASLSGTNHGNDALEDLYRRFEIGQISKLPGGNLRVKVKSKEACLLLERTKVNILGGVFMFKEFGILGGKYR